MPFQTCMTFLLQFSTEEHMIIDALDAICQCNYMLCVRGKKVSHTALEQHERELYDRTITLNMLTVYYLGNRLLH